jgi:uncharacterized RDD family membrane protein YckC
MMETKEITFSNRLTLLILDPFYGSMLITLPLILLIILFNWLLDLGTSDTISRICLFIFVAVYLNKDIIKGKSLAKRVLGYRVVKENEEQSLSMTESFFRNLTFFIYLAEYLFAVVSPNKKIGDYLTKSKIIRSDKVPLKSIIKEFGEIEFDNDARQLLGLNFLLLMAIMFFGI